jgi:Beta-lactamase superfamily domain
MRIHICGVRGSTPAPGAEFLRYGGHTSCLAIAHEAGAPPALILDAGTGLCQVTPLLRGKAFAGTILLTHLHWDHVHGLPFFRGGDRDDARVILLIPENSPGSSAEAVLAGAMSPPHFPIPPSGLRGNWTFGTVVPGRLKAEGFAVEAREVPHKGGRTLGYRVSDGHAALAYIPDHCPTVLGPDRMAGVSIIRRRWIWQPGWTCWSMTRCCSPRRLLLRHRSAMRRLTMPCASARWRARGGSCSPTTSTTAPTMRLTGWLPASAQVRLRSSWLPRARYSIFETLFARGMGARGRGHIKEF